MNKHYEGIVDVFMDMTYFELHKHGDVFRLLDLDDVNLVEITDKDIHSFREIVDGMEMYIYDYILSDLEYFLHDDFSYDEYEDIWKKISAASVGFPKNLQINIDFVNLIVNHIDEVDLEKCNYVID